MIFPLNFDLQDKTKKDRLEVARAEGLRPRGRGFEPHRILNNCKQSQLLHTLERKKTKGRVGKIYFTIVS